MRTLRSSCWETKKPSQTPLPTEDWQDTDECQEPYESEGYEEAEQTGAFVADAEVMRLLTSVARELKEKLQTVAPLDLVRKEIAGIKGRLARLEEGAAIRVPIQSLAPASYELVKPIEAVVQLMDDEYVASFFDANLSTGGDTQVEAMSNLRDLIVGTFEILIETKDSELGPGPSRQKAVLREFIRVR